MVGEETMTIGTETILLEPMTNGYVEGKAWEKIHRKPCLSRSAIVNAYAPASDAATKATWSISIDLEALPVFPGTQFENHWAWVGGGAHWMN